MARGQASDTRANSRLRYRKHAWSHDRGRRALYRASQAARARLLAMRHRAVRSEFNSSIESQRTTIASSCRSDDACSFAARLCGRDSRAATSDRDSVPAAMIDERLEEKPPRRSLSLAIHLAMSRSWFKRRAPRSSSLKIPTARPIASFATTRGDGQFELLTINQESANLL